MNLGELIMQVGKEKGLSDDVISRILMNAERKLPGNVPEERWEEQVMLWIDNAAMKQRTEANPMPMENSVEDKGIDMSILGGQAPQIQFQNDSVATYNDFGEIIRDNIEEKGRVR